MDFFRKSKKTFRTVCSCLVREPPQIKKNVIFSVIFAIFCFVTNRYYYLRSRYPHRRCLSLATPSVDLALRIRLGQRRCRQAPRRRRKQHREHNAVGNEVVGLDSVSVLLPSAPRGLPSSLPRLGQLAARRSLLLLLA